MTDCPWPKSAPTVSRLYPSRGYAALSLSPSDSRLMTGFAGGGASWPARLCLVVASAVYRHYCGVRICLSFDNKAGFVFTRP